MKVKITRNSSQFLKVRVRCSRKNVHLVSLSKGVGGTLGRELKKILICLTKPKTETFFFTKVFKAYFLKFRVTPDVSLCGGGFRKSTKNQRWGVADR